MTETFDTKAEAAQSVVLGTYDHLAKAKVWIERLRNSVAAFKNPTLMRWVNEALVELEMARLVRGKEEGKK